MTPLCKATNAAGDVCALVPPHRCQHRTADGRDFGAEQPDAEIGALIRAAFARQYSSESVEFESLESVDRVRPSGPDFVELRVEVRLKLKGGARG